MATTTRRNTTKVKPISQVTTWFSNWLGIKDEASQLLERQEDLRKMMLDEVKKNGVEDDKGNTWFEFPEPITFKDRFGKVFKYTTLKREKHLSPANPLPDPDKAEALLRELKLWLKPADEKKIREVRIGNPYITVNVEVDVDAVASAYFKGIITEEQYEGILQEQSESFQFRPSE